jgi:hypothetical protein
VVGLIYQLRRINNNMNQTNNKIREEFEAYLLDNWDDRENLPVADWWLAKLDLAIKEERKRITGIIRQVGALENDEEVEKLIDIINNG